MSNFLFYEATQARIADLHREAERGRLAALARTPRRRWSGWRDAFPLRFDAIRHRRQTRAASESAPSMRVGVSYSSEETHEPG
jgi:hypothetical protein